MCSGMVGSSCSTSAIPHKFCIYQISLGFIFLHLNHFPQNIVLPNIKLFLFICFVVSSVLSWLSDLSLCVDYWSSLRFNISLTLGLNGGLLSYLFCFVLSCVCLYNCFCIGIVALVENLFNIDVRSITSRGPGGSVSQVVRSKNSYNPITKTAWVRAQLY